MRKIIVMVLLFAGAAWAGSATQPAGADKAPAAVLRVYDIRDYLNGVSNYPLAGASQQKPTSRPAPNGDVSDSTPERDIPASQQDKMDEVCKMIEMIVEPDSWRDAGGEIGSLLDLDGKLYITQSPQAQAQVQKLVDEIVATSQQTMQVNAFWLLLSDDELAALREPAKAGEDAVIIRLNDAAMQKATPMARAQLLCLDEQTVHITAGAGRMKLQVNPTLSARKGLVILDVLNEVGKADAPATQPAGDDQFPEDQRFHTTARVPLGEDVVIGGMTMQAGEGGKPGRELYLVVRVVAE